MVTNKTDLFLTPMMGGNLPILIGSWGLKKGPIPKADIVLDCRALPDGLPTTPGYLVAIKNAIPFKLYRDLIIEGLNSIARRRANRPLADKLNPIRIVCLCAYGQNRSVAMKKLLLEELTKLMPNRQIKELKWDN